MILGRDWDHFCFLLGQADAHMYGLSTSVSLSITMNGFPKELPDWKTPIDNYFTRERQEYFLSKAAKRIQGFQHVHLIGVDADLAAKIDSEITEPPWTEPRAVIKELQRRKDAANAVWSPSNPVPALEQWTACVTLIRRIRSSITWEELVDDGGESFLTKFTELYFTTVLNLGQGVMRQMQLPSTDPSTIVSQGLYITRELYEARMIPSHFADDGSEFEPEVSQMAKLGYRAAVCWRCK